MIYLYNNTTATMIGAFDSILLAKSYLNGIGITDYSDYIYLERIEDMNYISRICYVDDVCIYNNKDFWLNESQSISNNFELHTVLDSFNQVVSKHQFDKEMNQNSMRLNNIYTTADEINYNIKIGTEFISLFREECVNSDLGEESGLSIASALSGVIPLVQTGSFDEAVYVISTIPRSLYLSEEKLNKYADMLKAADAITYIR